MTTNSVTVQFWGVRGSIPCPGPDTVRYGGNTSCVEVRCGDHVLIFDAGSGIRMLGNQGLFPSDRPIDIFLSHCHIDHLIGLPFFAPMFERERHIRIWGNSSDPAYGVRDAIDRLMSFPLFPIGIDTASAKLDFRDFEVGDILAPATSISLRTARLNHPGGAVGYRLEYHGKAVSYVTDTELGDGAFEPALLALSTDADLLILDTTYTNAELPAHVGWGHSSWEQGVAFAKAANVKTLCLYHHDPDHSDETMDRIAADVAKACPGSIVATEGLILNV